MISTTLALLAIALPASHQKYFVSVRRINNNTPVLNSQWNQSEFTYNYNPSYVPIYGKDGNLAHDALLVRCQHTDGTRWGSTPSKMPLSMFEFNETSETVEFSRLSLDDVVFESAVPEEDFGVEDPRVAYRAADKTYYMMYSAV